MISFQKGMKLDTDAPEGIWLDYANHVLLFFIKDAVWTEEEIRRTMRSDITVSLIRKGIVDAFLLEIYDCLEPSDVPFCIKEAGEDLLSSLRDGEDYACRVILVDGNNEIQAVRSAGFRHSAKLKEALLAREEEQYGSDDFDRAYEALAAEYEPYELEKFALFTEKLS